MTSPLSKLQMKRRTMWLVILLIPSHMMFGFDPILVIGSIILAIISSIIAEYKIINLFVYNAPNDSHREIIFANGFNGTVVVILGGLLLALVSAAKNNWILFLFGYLGYFLGVSTWVAYWCSKTFYRSYTKELEADNEAT